jgi:A/G-specific adenine glycosylase
LRNAAAAHRCALNKVIRSLLPKATHSLLLEGQLKEFRGALLAWFAQFHRDLPWRRSRDPYRIWISEIMLQQTRVAAVIPYYERFLARFPNVQALAAAPEEEVLRVWSGLGYYSRARNLQQAAKQIVAKHGGEFPRTKAEVLELSGIGEYTAPAILSIALGEKLAVLDGNVARVLARLDAVRDDLRGPGRWRELQERADELLDCEAPGDWNEAMMELGATLCAPRAPQCLLCPVQRFCNAQKLGLADEIPLKRAKRAAVVIRLAAAVFLDSKGKSLLLPPPTAANGNKADDHVPSLVAKLWHFPTLSTAGNTETELKRFLKQEFALRDSTTLVLELLTKVRHTVTYRKLEVAPFLIRIKSLPRISGTKAMRLDAILREPISNLTRKVAQAAIKKLASEQKTDQRS